MKLSKTKNIIFLNIYFLFCFIISDGISSILHCANSNSEEECINCEDGYTLSNGLCYTTIENCDLYEADGNCNKCEEEYAFEENERSICKIKTDFEEYYTKDGGISYFKCDGEGEGRITNCKKCEYNNGLICNECKNGYILKDEENNICYDKTEFNNDKTYYIKDEYHIRLCSNEISNCEECIKEENEIKCEKCKNGYYFKDEDYHNCLDLESISEDEYFYENNQYYSCEQYNSISNCKNCNSRNTCNICKNEYTFIDASKSTCNKITDLGNHYIQDLIDTTIYRECSNYITNCDTCTSKDECLTCLTGYGVYKDKKSCVNINDDHYYKNNDDNLYYKCIESLDNCDKCSSESICTACISDNYVNTNNKCFIKIDNCNNYDQNGKCIQCAPGYEIINIGNNCQIEFPNCIQVDNNGICTNCESGYTLYNNLCYTTIENCESYETDGKCNKCIEGFAFEENNKLICKNKNLFEEYYTKDEGISFFKCDGEGEERISNCKKCEYNDELICNQCKDDYILKDGENNRCYLKNIFDSKYYYKDQYHVKLCSEQINNCEECEKEGNIIKCTKCQNNYYFIDEDYFNCVEQQLISADEYYYENNQYYSCGNHEFHIIENCKKCVDGNSCNLCKDGYTFIDDSKSTCNKISDLGNQYYIDINDNTIYRKCEYYIDFCITCSSNDECLSCKEQYGLFNDKKICIDLNSHEYYKKNNLYYICSDSLNNCLKCSSETSCIACVSDNYFIQNNKCILKIDHCTTYQDDGKCTQCIIGYEPNDEGNSCKIIIENCIAINNDGSCKTCENDYRLVNNNCYIKIDNCRNYEEQGENCIKCDYEYAFEENNRLSCKNKNLFLEGYYTKDDGISYFKCDEEGEGRIRNCKSCKFAHNQLICNECKSDYVLKDDETNICYSKDDFNNDNYYYEDLLHVKTCSKKISHCEQCEKNNENIKCKKCFQNYYFVNEDYFNCININDINPINEYFIGQNNIEYFSCIKYNDIQNCKICDNTKDSCSLCINGYTFIDNNKAICKNISDLGEHYYIDPNDNRFYRKCSDAMENCDTCSSENICLSCFSGYGLFYDKTQCININDKKYYQKSDNYYYLCSESLDKCVECLNQNKCLNCIIGYEVVNSVCKDTVDHCKIYENNYKCIQCGLGCEIINDGSKCKIIQPNCIDVNDNGECINCEENYRLSNKICYKKVENCEIYEEDERCNKCKEGYAFKENERLICTNINELEEYYSKDGGISYFKCDEEITNCKKCHYNNELICDQCKIDYILKNDEYNICYEIVFFNNDKKYFYKDNYHIRLCSMEIDNCEECEKKRNDLKCTKCKNDYFLVNDDYYNCKQESQINPIDEYYLNDQKDHYFSCGNKNFNSIENCKKCKKKDTCYLCKEGYTFIDSNKIVCENITNLGNRYIHDTIDTTIYRKCSTFIQNCYTCTSKEECTSCINQNALFYDKSKCVYINDDTYYKNPTNNLYYKCSEKINNCQKCSSENSCNQCNVDYIRINSDNSKCIFLSDINNIDEYYADPKDDNMYLKCSSYIDNCKSCDYKNGCKLCKSEYAFINDDYKKCIDKSKISPSIYYIKDENENMYYSCNEAKYRNNIKCFSLIPNQNIILTFVQIQKINSKLYCYMMTHSPLPAKFSLKLKINIYNSKSKKIRNLEESIDIDFTINDDSDGTEDKIITFVSKDLSDEIIDINSKDIKVEDIKFNNDDSTTKIVTNKNSCSVKFDKNSELLDTGIVKSLIQAREIPDCTKTQQKKIINLNMSKFEECEFNLNSDESISFSNNSLNLELEEYNNKNIIIAKCNTEKKKTKEFQCIIDDYVNNDYTIKNTFISDTNKFIIINSFENNDIFKILCKKKNNKKIIIIAVIVCSCVILITTIIILVYCILKNKKRNNRTILDSKSGYNNSTKKYLTNKREHSKNNFGEMRETDQYLNINIKKKEKKSKSKKK